MSAKREYHRLSFCLGQNGENYDDPSASTANLFLVTFHDLDFSFNGARGAPSCMCVCVCACARARARTTTPTCPDLPSHPPSPPHPLSHVPRPGSARSIHPVRARCCCCVDRALTHVRAPSRRCRSPLLAATSGSLRAASYSHYGYGVPHRIPTTGMACRIVFPLRGWRAASYSHYGDGVPHRIPTTGMAVRVRLACTANHKLVASHPACCVLHASRLMLRVACIMSHVACCTQGSRTTSLRTTCIATTGFLRVRPVGPSTRGRAPCPVPRARMRHGVRACGTARHGRRRVVSACELPCAMRAFTRMRRRADVLPGNPDRHERR
jgi:hypothetical protein